MLTKLSAVKKFVALKLKKTTMKMSPSDDREDAEVAGLDVVHPAPVEAGETARLRLLCGRRRALADHVGRAHCAAPAAAVVGMPETFVGTPAVIASTTSCCVVFARS